MQITNTVNSYGWVSIALHWLVALTVFSLFGLGLYMVDLSYYDPLYRTLPDWHRSTGLILGAVVLGRLLWRWWSPVPRAHGAHSRLERLSARLAHTLFYLLIFTMIASGYLISTAKGQGVSIFGWIELPSLTGRVDGQEDVAGLIHYWCAWVLVALAGLHAAGALKHHFLDKDDTLLRMMRPKQER